LVVGVVGVGVVGGGVGVPPAEDGGASSPPPPQAANAKGESAAMAKFLRFMRDIRIKT
jgi:hypothetical protein